MARTANDDIRVKGFGFAAHLLFESLVARLIAKGLMDAAELQILYLEAMQNCSMHELPSSPWADEALEAHNILNTGKANAQQLYGP